MVKRTWKFQGFTKRFWQKKGISSVNTTNGGVKLYFSHLQTFYFRNRTLLLQWSRAVIGVDKEQVWRRVSMILLFILQSTVTFHWECENYNKKKREKKLVYGGGAVGCFELIKLPSSELITKSVTKTAIWLISISIHLTSEWVCSTTHIVVEA
jgi:hypothetical protein